MKQFLVVFETRQAGAIGAFSEPELIDPELLALAGALQPEVQA